ncbi:3-phosphoshikimate 1-carboxyvinyltransferase [Alphaproteobacteria bacterium]|nr:3-phosphoshikimate 1-carboxyvinyltransferase [Alphaproteobacteria bacterium]
MLISSKIYNGINGEVEIPGDKSISHRSIIIPSISNGVSEVSNILKSEDVLHTMSAFKQMGVKIEEVKDKIIIYGQGLNSLNKPSKEIYLGNSGTSARLLIGLLSSQNFISNLTGDISLSSRPMGRIMDPLNLMGAKIDSVDKKLPIRIYGQKLIPIRYTVPVPSAQVKSGLILAALNTEGVSKFIEKDVTRDHTEIMLESFGADIDIKEENKYKHISIIGKKELTAKNINVPSDLSSSAFFIVACLINKNSKLTLKNININPSRNGILRTLKKMKAKINITNKRFLNNEIVADLNIKYSKLEGVDLDKEMAKLMIDEYPILSIAASFAETPSIFRGLKELKIKESNRLELIYQNLIRCGVRSEVKDDDLYIYPTKEYSIKDSNIITKFDHRIAMAFSVMGTRLNENLKISESECINTSFPNFFKSFNSVGGKLIE